MEIIGLSHNEKYRAQVEAYLDENYPNGIRSLLVELPPTPQDFIDTTKSEFSGDEIDFYQSFFSPITRKYRNKGTRIIHGDVNRKIFSKRDMILHPLETLDELFGKRDDGIRQIFEQELPEVTLLGSIHAGRLKKAFPEIPFTYFYNRGNSLGEKIGKYIADNLAKNADRRICLE